VAGYIVRNSSYFSWYSEQSEHRERYARCGRGIRAEKKKGDKLTNWQVRFSTPVPVNCAKHTSCEHHPSDRRYPDGPQDYISLRSAVTIGDIQPDSYDMIMFQHSEHALGCHVTHFCFLEAAIKESAASKNWYQSTRWHHIPQDCINGKVHLRTGHEYPEWEMYSPTLPSTSALSYPGTPAVLTVKRINTLRTGDANLRFLRYNCERWMMQNCLLTRTWFLRT
jgi:hypothetical protein